MTETTDRVPPTTSERVRVWRVVLIAGGLGLLGIALIVLINDNSPSSYLGIAVWLIGALIIHDGIGALLVFGVAVLLRRTGRRIPFAVLAVIQGALVLATIVTVLVIPAAVKKEIGTANPTILPLDYVVNLGVFYLVLAVVTGVTIAVVLRLRARTTQSGSGSHARIEHP